MWVKLDRHHYNHSMSYFQLPNRINQNNQLDEWSPRYYSIVGYQLATPAITRVDLRYTYMTFVESTAGIAKFPIKIPLQCVNNRYHICVDYDISSIELELEANDLSGDFDIGQYEPLIADMISYASYQNIILCFNSGLLEINSTIPPLSVEKI